MTSVVFLLIASFLLSLLLVFLIIQNFSKQLLDIPNERSSHVRPTPRGGGLGFVITFIIGILVVTLLPISPVKSDPLLPLILLPLAIIGFLDDRYNLPSIVRYGVQLGVAIFAIIRYGIFPQPLMRNLSETKARSLGSYRGVMRDFPHPRSEEILKGLAAYRGGQAGMKYAEAFQTAFHALTTRYLEVN